MARTGSTEAPSETYLSVEKALTGILAVLVADREGRLNGKEERSTDVVLADAGFSYGEISQLTARPYEAVKSAVRRNRTPAKKVAA